MSYQDIIYEIRNGVAWIFINRPGQDERVPRQPPATS